MTPTEQEKELGDILVDMLSTCPCPKDELGRKTHLTKNHSIKKTPSQLRAELKEEKLHRHDVIIVRGRRL